MNVSDRMLLILAIDPGASLRLSTHARRWYVSASISVTDGQFTRGLAQYRSNPAAAVTAYLTALQEVQGNSRLVTGEYRNDRREWRWNGAAWAELQRSDSERMS